MSEIESNLTIKDGTYSIIFIVNDLAVLCDFNVCRFTADYKISPDEAIKSINSHRTI